MSVGTSGIGAFKITVTTIGALDLNLNIITIQALEDAVVGAARAEGPFIIDPIPGLQHHLFCKSKGRNN